MDGINLLLIILIIMAFFLVIRHILKGQAGVKPVHIKKEEIIQSYKKQMFDLKEKYKYDEQTLKQQKMILLKHVNAELHRNIFFDEDEIKQIIQQLAAQ